MDYLITRKFYVFPIPHVSFIFNGNLSIIFSLFLSVWLYEVKFFNFNFYNDNFAVLFKFFGQEADKIGNY